MLPNQPIALVDRYEPLTSWTANPGDVLYLPPNIIHHGVSLDPDCMTLSIGFRAPDAGALLEGQSKRSMQIIKRYVSVIQTNTHRCLAEILVSDLQEAKATIIRYLDEPHVLEYLLATRVTAPYLDMEANAAFGEEIDPLIDSVTQWELDPGCRMAYVNQTLYVNGERIGVQTPSELLNLANTVLADLVTSAISKNSGSILLSNSFEQVHSYRALTTIREANWADSQEALQSIRTQVFIEEQGIDPLDEWDPRIKLQSTYSRSAVIQPSAARG